MQYIWSTDSLAGLWAGGAVTWLKASPAFSFVGNFIWFACYYGSEKQSQRKELSFSKVCGPDLLILNMRWFFSQNTFSRLRAPAQELVADSGISSICLLEQFCEVVAVQVKKTIWYQKAQINLRWWN